MTGSRNVNRCTPCLDSHHDRCTGSAGNVGCGCIHAAPVPVSLDPARVRERLAELDLCVRTQCGIVERLDSLLDDERRELRSLERQLSDLRAHPAVTAALAEQPS
jgi:hypothetical protein